MNYKEMIDIFIDKQMRKSLENVFNLAYTHYKNYANAADSETLLDISIFSSDIGINSERWVTLYDALQQVERKSEKKRRAKPGTSRKKKTTKKGLEEN